MRCSRNYLSTFRDPIDDTKSTIRITLDYLIKGRYIKSKSLPCVHLSKNGILLRRNILQKYKEDIVSPDDILLSRALDSHSLRELAKDMNGRPRRSVFLLPPEGPSDVCHVSEGKEESHAQINPLSSLESFNLKSYVFLNKAVAWRFALTDVLRERRVWWKRFFFYPSSVFIPEEVESNSEFPTARICTHFEGQPWKLEDPFELESFNMMSNEVEGYKVLETRLCPTLGTFALLLDGVRERMFLEGKPRLALSPTIVPHQLSVSISGDWMNSGSKVKRDLFELRVFLSKELRREGIRLYDTPETRLDVIDVLGIPFMVILSPKTLEDGICNVWERETYWFEEVHISDLVKKFVRIYQNRNIPSLN